MNSTMKLGTGVVAACAAGCAVTLAPAILAGAGGAAFAGAAFSWKGAVASAAVAGVAAAVVLMRRSRSKRSGKPAAPSLLQARSGCGCGPSDVRGEAIACTLAAKDFKARTAAIRELAKRSLIHSTRGPLSLALRYDIASAAEVRELVAQERECCPFLTFSVRESGHVIEVVILAPEAAAEAADALFDHFAPELASKLEVA